LFNVTIEQAVFVKIDIFVYFCKVVSDYYSTTFSIYKQTKFNDRQ